VMTGPVKPIPDHIGTGFKYPSEDETFVRRLGSAALVHWGDIPAEVRDKIMMEASLVWDREYHIPQLPRKIEAFVRRHQSKPRRD